MDLALVQPPLPAEEGGDARVLVRTGEEGWCRVVPLEWSRKCRLGWWDLKQATNEKGESEALLGGDGEGGEEEVEGYENWWPAAGRWYLGIIMEDATIEFGVPERWEG